MPTADPAIGAPALAIRRAPWHKRLRRALVGHLVVALFRCCGLLPWNAAMRLGAWLGGVAFRFAGEDRRHGLEHLARAFPGLDERARTELLRRSFRHFGVTAMEVAQQHRIDRGTGARVDVSPRLRAAIDGAVAQRRGIVGFTGHLGSWEQLARIIGRTYPGHAVAVAAEMRNPVLRDFAERYRASGEVRTLWRGRPGARAALREALANGCFLGLLVDQDTRVRNVFVPFFGHPAATPRGGAELVFETGALPLFLWDARRDDGSHLVDGFVLDVPRSGDPEADVVALISAVARATEDAIRPHPEQWPWPHRRWKTRPDEGT